MRALSRRREEALRDTGRMEFTGGIFRKLAYAFCDSAYITPANYADTLSELVALFYAFKSDIEDSACRSLRLFCPRGTRPCP
ncbi:MAG: DUF6323 family protein, partial [Christensenellales bacterium]